MVMIIPFCRVLNLPPGRWLVNPRRSGPLTVTFRLQEVVSLGADPDIGTMWAAAPKTSWLPWSPFWVGNCSLQRQFPHGCWNRYLMAISPVPHWPSEIQPFWAGEELCRFRKVWRLSLNIIVWWFLMFHSWKIGYFQVTKQPSFLDLWAGKMRVRRWWKSCRLW